MSSIESLKQTARRHEQREEWQKALDEYRKAIDELEAEEQPDITLYNRVGDLQTRLGRLEAAAEAYINAVDLYVESDLPNNAIAVCKKIIRNMPLRNEVYLKMGQIRAKQGFLVEARDCFITYAERAQAAGDLDEALRSLVEYADLAPEDLDIRLAVAEQLRQHERDDEAIEHLRIGYRNALSVDGERVEDFEEKILELDPSADLDAIAQEGPVGATSAAEASDHIAGFQEIALDGEPADEVEHEVALDDVRPLQDADALPDDAEVEAGDAMELEGSAFEEIVVDEDSEAEDEVAPLPTFGLEDDEIGAAVPADPGDLELGDLDTGGTEPDPLPTFDLETESEPDAATEALERAAEEVAAESEDPSNLLEQARERIAGEERDLGLALLSRARDAFEEAGDLDSTLEVMSEIVALEPDVVGHRQRVVELAFRKNDSAGLAEAYLQLAGCMERTGEPAKAEPLYRQVLSLDPGNETAAAALERSGAGTGALAEEVASSEEYIDLGGLILDDEDERSTRFTVAYEEPSGDEQADFARMLAQFKQKISENVGADDVRAHHDLGTAYKEMGLLDEAIAEFQAALRASTHHLPTYELLGQVFMEKEEYEAAVRTLERALEAPYEVEDELISIYYQLGVAYEALGNTDSAKEFYERVFSLDINFADVTERLRELR